MTADSIEASLQPGIILRLSPAEYISHLRAIVAGAPADQHDATVAVITNQLQSHVHSSAIPPILFSMWLPMALPHLPQLLKDMLGDKESRGVRKAGRRQLRRAHRGRKWSENGWKAVGGIEGVRSLFNSLSVSDVHPLVMAIAENARSRGIAGDVAVDQLLEALTDGSREVRRLEMTDITRLLLSCSTPFIIEWLQKKPLPSFPLRMVFRSLVAGRLDLARSIATGSVSVHPEVRSFLVANLPAELIWSPVPYKPKYTPVELSPKSPSGTRFCFDLLHSFQDEQVLKMCPSTKGILDILQIAEKHAIRHNTPFDDILSLMQLGLATAALQVEKPTFERCDPRLVVLLHYWSIAKYPDYAPNYSINYEKNPQAARWNRKKHPVATLSHHRHPLSALSHPSRPNAKHQAALEKLIVYITKSIPENRILARHMSYTIFELFRLLPYQHFAPAARLPLIKLLYRHVSAVRVDLDNPQLSDEEWRRIDLDAEILTVIPPNDSRWLFSRLPNLEAAESLITFRSAGRGSNLDGNGPWWFKYGQLKMLWEVEDTHLEGSCHETLKLLGNVKTEAEKSRDPDNRSMWAGRAARLAIRSKSVAILRDVTVWSRRYLRDHIVYPNITQILISSMQDNILSCVTLCPNRRPASLAALKALVEEANSLLLLHIEAALQYLREPNFQPRVYQSFSTLLWRIFSERIDGVQTLQRLGLGSESELVSILIESMMPILTLYGETGLADGNEQLDWALPNGITVSFKPRRLLALPFLDKLARHRDELWAQNRLKRNDLVATLGEGWPKGLPIQSLLLGEQWMAQALANPEAAPFVADRLRRVIFCDPEIALATVPRNTDIIESFVDNLPVAIRSYVGRGASTEVLGRIQRVWEHYYHVVPVAAGHIEMVKSLLKKIASAAGIEWMKEDMAPPLPPSLPVSENNSGADLEPVEWDPRPNGGGGDDEIAEINEVDKKPQNLLLCRLSPTEDASNWHWMGNLPKKPGNWSPAEPVDSQQSFWRTWVSQIHKLPMSSKDAVVASAMLYLDAFAAGDTRLLSNQFPAGILHPRYPSMYLDYGFLSSIGKSSNTREYVNDAILALRKLKSIVPPVLLRDLANSMLNKLIHKKTYEGNYCDSDFIILESATFKVISLLSLTDQPRLAYGPAVRVVEKMPGSSSWHRRLISVGLCKRLCSTHAKEMLQNFSCFILKSIDRQHAGNKTEEGGFGSSGGLDPSKKQYVKVTTLKLLAQLLKGGNSVATEISLDILRSLFVKSNHIDVKAAALGAIIELLGKNVRLGLEPDPKVYKVLAAFADAAAGPDERTVVSEAEWIAAENGGPLPNCDDHRPLLDLFLMAKGRIPDKFHEDYVRSVLFKIFDESTRQHTRWMRIFLGRCQLPTEEAHAAQFGPFIDNYANKLLSAWSDCISKGYLLRSRELSMGYRDCERLSHINKKLNAMDPTLGETNAGMHWKQYFQTRIDYRLAFGSLGELVMSKDLQPRFSNGITLEDAEEEYFQRIAIAAREPRYGIDGNPVVSLKPFESAINILLPRSDAENIPESRRRLLEKIVADVGGLHSKIWPEGSSEKPPLLPSLWNLRCRLAMTSPSAELVERVNFLCKECSQSSFAMGDYKQLVNAVGTITSDSQISLLVKLGKAAQNEHDGFVGCIKVQLVHYLLRKIKDITTVERRTGVESLLKSWLDSSNENIRRIAFSEMEKFASVKANNNFASHFGYCPSSEDGDDNEGW
ncbi:hypothetical protein VE03_06761 [Pseudogymnoascus sp. 23342-1-I1]|nr:hypothetical protein VE03_06761 [Pseudogymnoascus sp. 23342-1-I1]